MFVTGVFFLTTPYVGYLDNLFVLYVLGALVGFLEPARTSWGARSAVFLLSLLAMFTHPTTCVVFLGTMFVVLGWHILSMRFDFRAVLDRDLPALLSVFAGMFFGVFVWLLGKFVLWGTPGNLADAALPPPPAGGVPAGGDRVGGDRAAPPGGPRPRRCLPHDDRLVAAAVRGERDLRRGRQGASVLPLHELPGRDHAAERG